ncbi:MAG: type IV secretion system DNA-binding domain-containing protein [Steroidobacteraceae bacterium]
MVAAPLIDNLTHGWTGLGIAYGSVQAPMWVALAQSRAAFGRWVASPLIGAAVTAGIGVASALTVPALHAFSAFGGELELAGACTVSLLAGYGAGRVLAAERPARRSEYVRGAVVRAPPEPGATRAVRMHARREHGLGAARALTLAGVPMARLDETKHFKIIGTTGAGKSTAIAELLEGALARGDRAVIADPDGAYARRFRNERRGDVILSPFEPGGRRWDLFAEIDAPYDIEQLALALIPDQQGADRSWRGYARTLFSAVTAQARAAGVTDVAQLYDLLVVADASELKLLVGGTPAQPFFDEHNARMLDSIRSVASSAVGALQYVAQQRAPSLSVRQWVRGGDGVLFVPYRAGQIAALRSSISAWMRLAIFESLHGPEGAEPLWFVADELDALGPIDGLKDALARLRKFGGRCVLGFQSVAQVSSTYGAGEAQTIVENCGNSLILRCSANEHGGTARFASRLIGEREVVRTVRSRSRRPHELLGALSESEHWQVEPAVMDAQLERLADLEGYLKLASTPDWLRVRLAPQRALPASQDARRAMPAGAALGREEEWTHE